jgi:SAM-dependent methyltransferase
VRLQKNKTTETFDAERYWSSRLEQSYSVEGVGYLGMGEAYNRWMYGVRRRVFSRVVRENVELPRARVLDVGSGTGFYVELWRSLGATNVTGSDLSPVAVERLRERVRDTSFHQLDLAEPLTDELGQFDAISAMDVLFHIVDDERYAQAIANLAALLAPGGRLIFTENLLHRVTQRAVHQTSRSFEHVVGLLRENGLAVELRRPVFVLMNTPIDTDSRLLRGTWSLLKTVVRRGPRWGSLIGATLYPLELVLGRFLSEGPSTEIVLCRELTGAR